MLNKNPFIWVLSCSYCHLELMQNLSSSGSVKGERGGGSPLAIEIFFLRLAVPIYDVLRSFLQKNFHNASALLYRCRSLIMFIHIAFEISPLALKKNVLLYFKKL